MKGMDGEHEEEEEEEVEREGQGEEGSNRKEFEGMGEFYNVECRIYMERERLVRKDDDE